MSKTEPNHAAFACVDANSHLQKGLTKREYFAAMAMQGILAKESFAERLANEPEANNTLRKTVAYASVVIADELIKELNKGGEQ